MLVTVSQAVEETRAICEQVLSESGLSHVENRMAMGGVTEQRRIEILEGVANAHKATPDLVSLRQAVCSNGDVDETRFVFERALLLRAGLRSLDQIAQLPVEDSVKHLFCREFRIFANPPRKVLPNFVHTGHPFFTMVKISLLTRFPAGQLQWEISAVPRRYLLRVSPKQLPRTLYFLVSKAKAFHPYFETHLAVSSSTVAFLYEREFLKTFYRMAASMEKQPAIRGILGASWLHSAETHRVSPHLSFMNRPYLESGGLYIDLGRATPDSGFLAGDQRRRELFYSGQYKPTFALVMSTREQALAWKYEHSQLEEELFCHRGTASSIL